VKLPSERFLANLERALRKEPPGAQRAVSGGVYLWLDRSEPRQRRFTYRGVGGRPGGTCDTWQEAYDARQALEQADAVRKVDPLVLTRAQQRRLRFDAYTLGVYLPDAVIGLDALTRADYSLIMKRDVLPLIGHLTLAELEEKPGLITKFKTELAERKRFPEGHPRAGELPEAACNAAIKVASSVCEHAWRSDVIGRNPFRGINRFNRRRTPGGQGKGSYRRVDESELMDPLMMAAVGVGMRGTPAQLLGRRLRVVLITIGMRPQTIDAAPWSAFRDGHGPLRQISASDAVKDIHGHLVLGQPKTGKHVLYQFDWVAMMMDQLYLLQGCPPLSQIALPNTRGGLQDQGNWRTEVWYPALHRVGIASAPEASAVGAVEPYLLRHIGVTTMLAARRHDGAEGRYSDAEVARQFAHSPETLHRVYQHLPKDPHNVAGRTMDEIIRAAFREVWGAMPGDLDYEEVLLTTAEASALTDISINSLCGRASRGKLPSTRRGSRYLVSEFDLAWTGLLHPGQRRSQPGLPAELYPLLASGGRPDSLQATSSAATSASRR
jgi:hypothetical protein